MDEWDKIKLITHRCITRLLCLSLYFNTKSSRLCLHCNSRMALWIITLSLFIKYLSRSKWRHKFVWLTRKPNFQKFSGLVDLTTSPLTPLVLTFFLFFLASVGGGIAHCRSLFLNLWGTSNPYKTKTNLNCLCGDLKYEVDIILMCKEIIVYEGR